MIAHAFLTAMFLLSGQWIALLLNAPLVAFNVNKCVLPPVTPRARRPMVPSRAYTRQPLAAS
jgi:hypothetical protein